MGRDVCHLADHPNVEEITGLIARLPQVPDRTLPALAAAWNDDPRVADARDRALAPDSPLIVEVLAVFDAVQELWADDLAGATDLEPAMVATALHAIRDAVAGAYAKPVIGRAAHTLLLRPWRTVFPDDRYVDPLAGTADRLEPLMDGLARLATRCHDPAAAARWQELARLADERVPERAQARAVAFEAAVLAGRKRTWTLVRRAGRDLLVQACSRCRRRMQGPEPAAVVTLCTDAACAVLVADTVSDEALAPLTEVVPLLLPRQRRDERT